MPSREGYFGVAWRCKMGEQYINTLKLHTTVRAREKCKTLIDR